MTATDNEAANECYYRTADACHGERWTCAGCNEKFCQTHFHVTDKGRNVECVACERRRAEAPAPMPLPNHFFENVPRHCDVELRGTSGTQYYVATINGVEGVVVMDGQHQHMQQKKLDRMVVVTKRRKANGQ
jgi:hypothetical protein